jgi:hypothetical protein
VFRSHWWTSQDINSKFQCCIRNITRLGHIQSSLHRMLVQYSGTSSGFPSRFLLAFGKLKREVGIATKLRVGRLGAHSPLGAKIFLSCTTSRPALRAHPDSYSKDTVVLSPGVKRSGHEGNHSPLTSSEVRMGGALSLLPLYAFMAWTEKNYLYLNFLILTITSMLLLSRPFSF